MWFTDALVRIFTQLYLRKQKFSRQRSQTKIMVLNSNNEPNLINWKLEFCLNINCDNAFHFYVYISFNILYFVDKIKIFWFLYFFVFSLKIPNFYTFNYDTKNLLNDTYFATAIITCKLKLIRYNCKTLCYKLLPLTLRSLN